MHAQYCRRVTRQATNLGRGCYGRLLLSVAETWAYTKRTEQNDSRYGKILQRPKEGSAFCSATTGRAMCASTSADSQTRVTALLEGAREQFELGTDRNGKTCAVNVKVV
jgi:hypothetical protein